MSVHSLIRKQLIPTSIEVLWNFFSDAKNLSVLTPEKLNFRITSGELPDDIYTGQIITYKVSPILGIPMFWMTEITHVEKNVRFVDEQRVGPYRIWHHEHHFEQVKDGILMTDIVYYQLPFYFLGNIAHKLFVNKQLKDIFDFREEKIEQFFRKPTKPE